MAGLQDLIANRGTGRFSCATPNVSAGPRAEVQQALGSYRLNKAKADIKAAADKITKKEARRDLLLEQRAANATQAAAAEGQLDIFDKVQILLQKTSDYARQQIKGRIEEIVSQALNIVYGGDHKFTIELPVRSNRPEADYFLFDGNTTVKLENPDYNQGGGKINIITIALRLGIDELVGDTGPLLLDEIGSNVDQEAAVNLAYFLKEYSIKFNRQIILITHNDALADVADISLRVTKKNGEAQVKGVEV
jgi:DNA repair exonuclease SbcCD ATPase subunit